VQDQRFDGAVVEYDWRDDLTAEEIDSLVQAKRMELANSQKLIDELKAPMAAMIGKPAPPLPAEGWTAEPPELAGRPYLIHFWATWCGPCKSDFEILNRAARNRLVIGVHPAGTPPDKMMAAIDEAGLRYPTLVAAKSDVKLVGGYPVRMYPYCVVVDAAGRVAAHGTLMEVAEAFGELHDRNDGAADEPASIDDDPQAAAGGPPPRDEGSDLLRKLQRAAAPRLKELAEHGYALADSQSLKRIAPPFPEARSQWYRTANPTPHKHMPDGPDAVYFQWHNGELRNLGMSFGGPSLQSILESVAGFYPQFIESPAAIREREIPGDWIVRANAKPATIVADLQSILNDELQLGVRVLVAEIERDAYVLRGRYRFAPLPGYPAEDVTQLTDRRARTDPIQVFGDELVPNSGAGGGMGDFDEFCRWLGRWIDAPVISEAEQLPREVSWRLHELSPATAADRARSHSPDLVLPNIARQTGLEFAREKRRVQLLLIEEEQ
jgi:thiol-disulfide isomerase/thioredoxin